MYILSLIGMRGCGKSTIARALAQARGTDAVQDTDEVLVARAGRTIAELIASDGWKAFRELEAQTLVYCLDDWLAQGQETGSAILATGGGIVLRPENRTALHERTVCVYLHVSPEVAHARLLQHPDAAMRPPLSDASLLDEVTQTYAERHPLYMQTAHHTVDATRPVAKVVAAIRAQTQGDGGQA